MDDFKPFKDFLNENQNSSKNIEDYSWDELNGYTFSIYPHDITLITNASEEQVVLLWRQYYAIESPNVNFDGFLQERGYVAISASKSKIRPLDRLIG